MSDGVTRKINANIDRIIGRYIGRYMGRSIASSSTYLLAVLEDALLVGDAALGARGVVLPLATLHVDVHVQLPAEHGHLGLGQQAHGHVGRHLEWGDGGGRGSVIVYVG